jgi:hypothetical protein
MGLNLSEIPDHFPDSRSIEETGMFLWAMEAFTNPQSISLTMKIFREWNSAAIAFSEISPPWTCRSCEFPVCIRWSAES